MSGKRKSAWQKATWLWAACCLGTLHAQTCTTQSAMAATDRDALATSAQALGAAVQGNNGPAVKALTGAELARDFNAVTAVLASTAPHLTGLQMQVERDQVYLLDNTAATATADAEFDCTLNRSAQNVTFTIPQLPPGRYGFAIVRYNGANPWRLSLLLQQDAAGKWVMAGLYPKATTAGGHDGIWYWTTARGLIADKHPWAGWLYLQEAQMLLQPAEFVGSSHLEKLGTELTGATPPPAKDIGEKAPLVVRASDGQEFRFSALGVDDALSNSKPDVAAHLKVDTLGDAATARKRNHDAAAALVALHPELRDSFHGVLVQAEIPGQAPYATEESMAEIR